MSRIVLFFILVMPFMALGQSKLLRPQPISINLSDPKSSFKEIGKEEKKVIKQLQKEREKIKKQKDKYYKQKLDSLTFSRYELPAALTIIDTTQTYQDKKKNYSRYLSKYEKGKGYTHLDSSNVAYQKYASYKLAYAEHKLVKPFFKLDSASRDSLQNHYIAERATYSDSLISDQYSSPYLALPDSSSRQELDSISRDSLQNQYLTQGTTNTDSLIRDQLKIDNAQYDSPYLALRDSTYRQNLDSIARDSIQNVDLSMMAVSKLESRVSSYVEKSGYTTGLADASQQEGMMFNSYEEMIQSNEYKDLMSTMPGKKADIESFAKNQAMNLENYPGLENVFKGHEKELTKALAVAKLAKEKPTWQEVLGELFNQDMKGIKEEPFKERFKITGQLQISQYDPILLDYSPGISYAITSKISLGTAVTGRVQIGKGNATDDKKDLFGYRGYGEYDIFKGLYFHGEYERTGLMTDDPLTEEESRVWSDRWLIGIGKDIKMPGLLDGSILLLYNLDNNIQSSPTPKQWQVRYGVKF